ncbi:S-adenosyl-L-methionine-dependent methyltransferase [Mycena epipterygia]|nr:S-adenosyl-L-methionine-dependent methyltransferase [Mycena epipterygia]
MRFRAAVFDLVQQMWVAFTIGFPPVLRAIFASPSLLFNPTALSRISMANIWIPFGEGGDVWSRPDKTKLITPHATGVVLDLGSGHGHTANYLDRTKVTKYVAVEPNTLMQPDIRAKAQAAGFSEADGSLLILSCGAEDIVSIMSAVHVPVDTIISVLTLCTVPAPQQTLRALVEQALVPGGEFLFHEHVLNPRADVAWWQKFWTPVWTHVFDGCNLNRPTTLWIEKLVDDNGESFWAEGSIWDPSDQSDEENLFWRQLGRFVKK